MSDRGLPRNQLCELQARDAWTAALSVLRRLYELDVPELETTEVSCAWRYSPRHLELTLGRWVLLCTRVDAVDLDVLTYVLSRGLVVGDFVVGGYCGDRALTPEEQERFLHVLTTASGDSAVADASLVVGTIRFGIDAAAPWLRIEASEPAVMADLVGSIDTITFDEGLEVVGLRRGERVGSLGSFDSEHIPDATLLMVAGRCTLEVWDGASVCAEVVDVVSRVHHATYGTADVESPAYWAQRYEGGRETWPEAVEVLTVLSRYARLLGVSAEEITRSKQMVASVLPLNTVSPEAVQAWFAQSPEHEVMRSAYDRVTKLFPREDRTMELEGVELLGLDGFRLLLGKT